MVSEVENRQLRPETRLVHVWFTVVVVLVVAVSSALSRVIVGCRVASGE